VLSVIYVLSFICKHFMPSVATPNDVLLSVVMLNDVMLSVVTLNDVLMSVVTLNDVLLSVDAPEIEMLSSLQVATRERGFRFEMKPTRREICQLMNEKKD
jgi:hypothetical protein